MKDINGKTNNVRTLIANLHKILWEGHDWKEVSLGSLISYASVKVGLLLFHVMMTNF